MRNQYKILSEKYDQVQEDLGKDTQCIEMAGMESPGHGPAAAAWGGDVDHWLLQSPSNGGLLWKITNLPKDALPTPVKNVFVSSSFDYMSINAEQEEIGRAHV